MGILVHSLRKGDVVKTIRMAVTACLLALFFGCTSVYGAYKGKVVDAATGEPLEGVVVVGVWDKWAPSPAGKSSEFLDSYETLTDQNGMFFIPGTKKLALFKDFEIMIFKAGYEALHVPWVCLKKDEILKKRIKWEGDMAIVPLRKLSLEERKERIIPARPSIPGEKMQLLTKEINKERVFRGFAPFKEIEQ
jgi:hypothetical protein